MLVERVKVPTVLQMEAVECGAASLAMILAYWGRYAALEELRIACGVSRDGSKASNIVKAARSYGLIAKGYRKEPVAIKEMRLPAVIHWNFNHFLVLEGFDKGKVYLNDPGSGPRVITEEEFDQSFTGIVLTFEPGPDFVKSGAKPSMLSALKKRLEGSHAALTFVILVGLLLVVPGLIIPVFSRIFVDDILLGGKENWLIPLLLGMGFTALLRGILTWIQQYYLVRLETKIALQTTAQFYWHVLRLPVVFFTQRYAGDICSRVQSNDKVAQLLSGQLATNALNCVMVVFYFVLMIWYNLWLALVGALVAVINILYLRYVSRKRVDQNRKLLQNIGKLDGFAMSGLQLIETLKANGSESDFFAKWSGYQAKALNAEQEIGVSTQFFFLKENGDFPPGAFQRVGTVNDITADIDAQAAPDGAGRGLQRICGPHHFPGGVDGILALDDHGRHGTGGNESNQRFKKRFAHMFSVVLFRQFPADPQHFQGHKLKAPFFKAVDNFPDQAALDTIGFDHEICTLHIE
jgi:ABC-type bacteriocin/lantibiotic exporter with double-glycine peptidase domain